MVAFNRIRCTVVSVPENGGMTRGALARDVLPWADPYVAQLIKKLLDAGVELRRIRKAVDYLKERGDAPHGVTLMSDGVRIYEAATPEAVVDLLAQGQGVFAIAVDKVWNDLEGELQKPKTGRRKAAGGA